MSLLADLLSKKNYAEPSGGRDIPPTLTRSPGIPAKVRNFKSRYVVISLIIVATIALGLLAMTQFGRLTPLLTKKTVPLPQSQKPSVAAVTVAPVSPVTIAPPVPPVPPQVIEPAKPPVPVSSRKTATKRNAAKAKHAKHPAVTGTKRRLAAIQPVSAVGTPKSAVPEARRSEDVSSGKIDTAKRDAFLYAARSAEQASDWRLALANYRKAQKIDPDNFVIMNNSAAALNNLGMFEEGAREARRALTKKADYVPAMINAAIANSSKGNSQEALRLFSEATIADPGNRSLVINLGILQERTGKLDDAQITYRRLAEDGDPLALQGMGRIYERKGNRNEAVRVYRQILSLPNVSPTLKKEVKGKLTRLEE